MHRRAVTVSVSRPRLPNGPVLIAVDQSIPDQRNLAGRKIALVILRGLTNRPRDLAPLAPAAVSELRSIGSGDVVRIG